MPWNPDDAPEHTKKADTPAKKALWARVANRAREKYGDDATAIRIANRTVADYHHFVRK